MCAVKDVAIVLGWLSIVGSGYTVVLITQLINPRGLRRKRERSHAMLRIVRAMCLCDILFVTKFLATYHAPSDEMKWCDLAGFMGQTFGLATILFNLVIAFDVYRMVRDPFNHKTAAWVTHWSATRQR